MASEGSLQKKIREILSIVAVQENVLKQGR